MASTENNKTPLTDDGSSLSSLPCTSLSQFATMPPKHNGFAEGNADKYINRTEAIKYLQVSLSIFRILCILKGICPRVFEGSDIRYYSMEEIIFLAQDPLLARLRYVPSAEEVNRIRNLILAQDDHA